MRKRKYAVLLALAAVALTGATVTAAASASPVWKFNGTELSGNETIVGAAISSKLTIPGATTECTHFLYNMTVKNVSGAGKGEITELPLYECKASGVCTVESIAAESLPWQTHLTTVTGKGDYLIVEGVKVGIKYGGAECALRGTLQIVKGSAGGLINNTEQTATFDKATFEATGTALKVGASTIEWNGVFPTEPFETRREQLVEG